MVFFMVPLHSLDHIDQNNVKHCCHVILTASSMVSFVLLCVCVCYVHSCTAHWATSNIHLWQLRANSASFQWTWTRCKSSFNIAHHVLHGLPLFLFPQTRCKSSLNIAHHVLHGLPLFLFPQTRCKSSLNIAHHVLHGLPLFLFPWTRCKSSLNISHHVLHGLPLFLFPLGDI